MKSKPIVKAASLFGGTSQTAVPREVIEALDGVTDIGNTIQDALGVSPDAIESSEAFILTILLDDTGSIASVPNGADAVIAGHNLVIKAHMESKGEDGVIVHATQLINGNLYEYKQLSGVPTITRRDYKANGDHTPLYDRAIAVLGTVLAKEQEFKANGVPVRTATLIVTDGGDNSSTSRAADVAKVVRELRKRENHIVACMGICEKDDKDAEKRFFAIFTEMGIDSNWILTPDATEHAIREAFGRFSKSSVQASRGAASFSTTSAGGFAS
jgi:hypothetical protein